MYDENELVRLAAKGDDRAFEKLVALYEKRVYTTALRMTGNQDDAYDISQETFIRVYRSLKGFKGDAKFSTWIYRIVTNLCIDYNRKAKRIKQIPLENNDEEEPFIITISDDRFDPERNLERSEIVRAINRALDTLSEEHREIFILRELDGLSYAEIAEIKMIEEGTVKSRLFRAREKLRAALLSGGNIAGIRSSNMTKGGDQA
ncbi:MAG: sigma-70 family RNA polymerase sigma factor [Clostridiales bacterium]|nr:sigma-70 family RNA polymerase sigma factor [Clostridiales bacterium]